jgi:predicted dienelactone hydrolase
VKGYSCGDKSTKTLIFYPKPPIPHAHRNGESDAETTFHVTVYAHGIGGGDDGCDDWLETVASLGLIVIAPFTSGGACETEYKDMLLALSSAKQGGSKLHPALATADWGRVGVWGHSMGGMSVPGAGERINPLCVWLSFVTWDIFFNYWVSADDGR